MDCNETRALLGADLDRELPLLDARRVARHLDGCALCRGERDALAALGRAVQLADYHRAPPALYAKIVASLPGADARDARALRSRLAAAAGVASRVWQGLRGRAPVSRAARDFTPMAAFAPGAAWLAAAALVAGAAAGVAFTAHRGADDALVAELVSSHVRAALSGHDIDVVSTDRHTVKPWFNGRLDYAPPVVDLASSGFTLAGGRLDYVGGRRVAVLVYHYRRHVVDAYVFPMQGGSSSSADSAVEQGYALARWYAGGMTWWAVTDAEPGALAAFRAALAANLPPTGQ
ncbi:anti-sigma factor family protein [Burkholderia singularis]|uniref:Putative zinc-finger domain-containing protein n=1 Tax=Burkholderia singularis TaxID=1503053 RepID=A0A238GYI9_9BURK|nr:zf-HC2 domain-containing protein [Burkholderia singularis]SMF97993.1 FIG00455102: hypothetical protein [Burkholderia singularis]